MKNLRLNLVFVIVFLFAGLIIARLVFLQIVEGELHLALAKGQQEIFSSISGNRGDILLHDKKSLVLGASNKNVKYCYSSPELIEDKPIVAKKLASVLGLNEETVLKEMQKNNSLFLLLKKDISDTMANEIENLCLDNVHIGEKVVRFYPNANLASDVIGFVNQDGSGQYGLEGYWEDILRGKEGWQKIEFSPFGKFQEGESSLSAKGCDLILTIDKNIQLKSEELLVKFSENFQYESAQIIVAEPKSGKILAMADYPFFDPNNYKEYEELGVFQNKNIQVVYEPGSVFKAVTMATALNEGKITPETTYIDRGYVEILDKKINNYENRVWGKSTMTEVLEKSINTGAVFAQSQVNNKVFLDYLERFEIFKKTNIELQGEVFSENKEFKKGWAINFATAAFGQGIEMTPLQVVRTYCAIANKGILPELYLVEGVRENGETTIFEKNKQGNQIISEKTASQLVKMLISVAENGYSKPAKVDGYYIAGKTGTSQISYSALGINKSGYSDQTWQSFIGFAPAFEPEFVILIKLDNPATKSSNESATLVFKELAKYILDYYQIPPEKENDLAL